MSENCERRKGARYLIKTLANRAGGACPTRLNANARR